MHFGEPLGGSEGLLIAVSFMRRWKVWVEEESRMPNESEFQTMGVATLKPRDAKIVQTHGTDNRLAFAEHRERVGYGNSKGSVGMQDEWSREFCGSV